MIDERSGQLVSQGLVDWADKIFLMDEMFDSHLTRLSTGFNLRDKEVVVLDIRDIYARGDKVLIGILRQKLAKYGISCE